MSEFNEQLKGISTQLDGLAQKLEGKASTQELQEAKDLLNGISEKQSATDAEMSKINDALDNAATKAGELKDQVDMLKSQEANKGRFNSSEYEEKIDTFRKSIINKDPNAKLELTNFELNAAKAAEVMGPGVFYDGGSADSSIFTGREIDPEFYDEPRKTNLAVEAFGMRPIGVPTLSYMYKEEDTAAAPVSGDSGGAAWIASGAQKPLRSFRGKVGTVNAKKAAVYSNVHDTLLKDVASFENWIREDLDQEIVETLNDGLLNNDPGTNADGPLGVKTNATTFTAPAAMADFKAAGTSTRIDQVVAVVAQIAVAREMADVVIVSPDNYYRLHTISSSAGGFLNPGLVYRSSVDGQLYIAGTRVVMADILDVPSTHVLAKSNAFKVRNYGGLTIERGLNGEDFRNDMSSFRAYQEVLSYIPENRQAGVVYDTWANVITGIESA